MRLYTLLLVLIMSIGLVSAVDISADSGSAEKGTNFWVTINIDAPEILAYEFDLNYDNTLVTYNNVYELLDNNGNVIVDESSGYACGPTPTNTGTSLTKIFCIKLDSNNPDSSRDIARFQFIAEEEGFANFDPTAAIITNVTNVESGNGYAVINLLTGTYGITPIGISIGPSVPPSIIEIDAPYNIVYGVDFVGDFVNVQVVPSADYVAVDANSYRLDSLNTGFVNLVYAGGKITMDLLEANKPYSLYVNVDTPSLSITSETQDEFVLRKDFTVSSLNNWDGAYGVLPWNSSYPYVWLYWNNGTGFELDNEKFDILLDGENLNFSNVSAGTAEFYAVGNVTCDSDMQYGGYSTCVGGVKSRLYTDLNHCVPDGIQYIACTTPPDDGGSSSGRSSSGNGGGGSGEYTRTFEFSGDVFEMTITYTSITIVNFDIDYEDIDIGVGVPYKAFSFESSRDLPSEDIASLSAKYIVNDFWMENNDIVDIKVYAKEGSEWKKISNSEKSDYYEMYSDSLGPFLIVGLQEEIEEQTPGIVVVKTKDDDDVQEIDPQEFGFTNFVIPLLLGILVIGAAISAVVLNARHPAKHGTPKDVPHVKMDKLDDYISKARLAGLEDNSIKANLTKVGWTKEIVDEAIAKTSAPNKPAAK